MNETIAKVKDVRMTLFCILFERWKGENVATTEVSDIITMIDFIEEANVYGVQVPGMKFQVV